MISMAVDVDVDVGVGVTVDVATFGIPDYIQNIFAKLFQECEHPIRLFGTI